MRASRSNSRLLRLRHRLAAAPKVSALRAARASVRTSEEEDGEDERPVRCSPLRLLEGLPERLRPAASAPAHCFSSVP